MKDINKYYNICKNKLYPINRSLTGDGVRKTLKLIKKEFKDLKIKKIKCGTKVFDWKVPPEWNLKEAFIKDKDGKKIIDFNENNLHIVGYSIPTKKFLKKKHLIKKIYSLKKQPNAIPYMTSYYNRDWGFCVTHKEKNRINKIFKNDDKFFVRINSTLNKNGFLNYGELVIKGKSKDEILISTYICHPSMANNELSGPIVSMSLINYFKKCSKLDKTLRFVFIPETIGSISYLYFNYKNLKKIIGGFNLSCIGDEKNHSCMFSKYGGTPSDNSIIKAYKKLKIKNYKIYSFLERGSDERQYNSPGIDLNIASIFRSKYGTFPEYHTSLDDFRLVTRKGILGGFKVAREAIKILSNMIIPKYRILCEPQLGRRGMYENLSKKNNDKKSRLYLSFLQYADGKNDLEGISKLLNVSIHETNKTYFLLKKKKLLI